jgi:hypothetical protein
VGIYPAAQIGTCHPGPRWQATALQRHSLSPPWSAGLDHPANPPVSQDSKWRTNETDRFGGFTVQQELAMKIRVKCILPQT